MPDIITISELTKKFGKLTAVDNISFTVREGELFAFLGPNGAGKSTTINIICTLMPMTSGDVRVDGLVVGREDAQIRRRIGIVFQDNVLDDLLTVRENLESRGALYGIPPGELRKRITEVCGVMGIEDIAARPYGKLSGGQKRRTEVARALLHRPKILILDEPTTGLDPQTRKKVWETVGRLRRDLGMTVFLTTHYMEEAAEADTVAVIDGGRIVAAGSPNELKAKYSTDLLTIAPNDMESALAAAAELGYCPEKVADVMRVPVRDSLEAYSLLKALEGRFSAFEMARGNMDDVFVGITGRSIREDD